MLGKILAKYLAPYRWWITAVVLLQFVASMASLYLPNLNARIIDTGVSKGDIDAIWHYGGIMLGVGFLQILAQAIAVYCGARVAMSFGRDLRHDIFSRVLDFSSQELNRFGAPSLITRNTNDVQQVQMLVMLSATILIGAPMMMIGGIFMAVREDVGMSWLIVVAMAVLGVVVGILASRLSGLFRVNQTRLDALNGVLREQITGIRVIRAFDRDKAERKRFTAVNADIRDISLKIGTLFVTMMPAVMLITNASSVGVIWFGGHRVAEQHIMVGQLTAFLTYLMQILMSVMMATMMMLILPRAQVCAERIGEVLETESSVKNAADAIESPRGPAELTFDSVEFTYPGAEAAVLHDLSFTMKPGLTTAVIGSTGSGKSTLVNLIPRLFDITGGQLLLDGHPVDKLTLDSLWDRIGLVPQAPYLFSGTVASNLRYGNPKATDEELWEALRWAQAEDFVTELGGLETPISQGGTNVSGGQRQRLSIARALVAKPDIYIFDDAFSALDVATDARLRAVLEKETSAATTLIVAQRVSSIKHADQIVVLDSGSIVGIGTHDELLVTCPTYAEIVDSQLAVEEVA